MTLLDHIYSAGISTFVIGAIAFLSKEFIRNKLLYSIKHDYDEKLEALKSDLKMKEHELTSLSSGALSGISFRKNELYKLQIIAVQKLWDEVIGLSKAKGIASIMRAVPFDKIAPMTEHDEKARNMFKDLGASFDIHAYDFSNAEKIRPFVSPLAWAFFSAYKAIILNDVIKHQMLVIGLNKDIFKDNITLTNLVNVALPEYAEYIDANKNLSLYDLLDILEKRLLQELNRILKGKDNDHDAVEQSADILKAVEKFSKETVKGV